MELLEKFLYQSNYWYNDGLKRAKVRDLSGAVISLRRSLKYNRDNIVARNLLGLVYYGYGEIAEALTQWIISKNLKPEENDANYYIKMIQDNPNELESYRQVIHKFNQCLSYCKFHDEDMAIIQLKQVIEEHGSFLKAYQLLALLYIKSEQYANARQILRRAHRIDNTNPMTLAYMYEVNQVRRKNPAKLKEKKPQTVSYKVGNETIIQPANIDVKERNRRITLMNLVIGIVVGIAVIWFLIIPAISQSEVFETNDEILAYSDEIAMQKSEISALKKELESYRNTSDEAEDAQETAASTQFSYEMLIKVEEQYQSNQVSDADMVANLIQINPEALGEAARVQYDELTANLYPKMLTRDYTAGKESYQAGNYQEAIAAFENVVNMQADYEEGRALLYLANAYAQSGEQEKANEVYDRVLELCPDTEASAKAQQGKEGTIPEVDSVEGQEEGEE